MTSPPSKAGYVVANGGAKQDKAGCPRDSATIKIKIKAEANVVVASMCQMVSRSRVFSASLGSRARRARRPPANWTLCPRAGKEAITRRSCGFGTRQPDSAFDNLLWKTKRPAKCAGWG